MCSDSNLSWYTANEYINLPTKSDEAINYDANANHIYADQQPQIGNCDEYPTIRRSDQFLNESSYRIKDARWLPTSYTWKVPWILIVCSAIQIVVHYIACTDVIEILIFRPQKKHDLWRFFTYHIIHFEQTHLFLNIFLQIFVGLPLETEQGHFRVLLVFICGVICGAIGSMLINPRQAIYGSSAAVYSLLFSHFSHCILNWANVSVRAFRIMAVFMLFGCDMLVSLGKHMDWIQATSKVSFAAHISGALAGLISGLLVFAKNKNQLTATENRTNIL